jgi:hypothetical protein
MVQAVPLAIEADTGHAPNALCAYECKARAAGNGIKTGVIPNLFRDLTGQVTGLKSTQRVGCRNKFGMTLGITTLTFIPSESQDFKPRNDMWYKTGVIPNLIRDLTARVPRFCP